MIKTIFKKVIIIFLFITTSSLGMIFSKSKIITVPKVPDNLEAFIKYRDSIAKTPEGGAVIMLLAMLKYTEDEELGKKFLIIALDRSQLVEVMRGTNVKGYGLMDSLNYHLDRLSKKKYMPRSYILGTSPENGYTLPDLPYKIEIFRTKYSIIKKGKQVKLFLTCTGADSIRPITLSKNTRGIWKALEYSTLFVEPRPPVLEDDGDDL